MLCPKHNIEMLPYNVPWRRDHFKELRCPEPDCDWALSVSLDGVPFGTPHDNAIRAERWEVDCAIDDLARHEWVSRESLFTWIASTFTPFRGVDSMDGAQCEEALQRIAVRKVTGKPA